MTKTENDISVQAENPHSEAATQLMRALTAEIAVLYSDFGQDGSGSFNTSDVLLPRSTFVVARLNGQPVGCGALRPMDAGTAEVKRMYVAPNARRLGVGRTILAELERLAALFGYGVMRLETGIRQPEARALYERYGFHRIPAFDPYIGNPISICYEKMVSKV